VHDITPFFKAIGIFESLITEAIFSQSEVSIPEYIGAESGLGFESWSCAGGIVCSISFPSFFLLE